MQTHADVKRPPELDTRDQRGAPEINPLVEYVDVATVLKISQAVSGEITLEKLVEVLLRTAIEQAGAERALLILPRGSELWIQAEAKTHGDSVTVRLNEAPVSTAELPESIVRHVARTQEIVNLDDASSQNPYSTDEYIHEQRLRSVCCLPLAKQNNLVALLYLENNIGPSIFAPAKISVLKVLASAAAISLDNSRLYRELQEREGRIRRLVDANIIGILISDSEGQIIESNDAFLKMVGYTREELVSGRMRWRNMTPAEWKDVSEQGVVQVKAIGVCKAFEKEYYRKDGSRVPVLVGAARFEKNSIVAFAIDLTERKRAEEALKRSEFYLAEGQRLAHMGSWVFNAAGFDYWSSELFRIHGLDPSRKAPTIEEYMGLIHPEDRGFVAETIRKLFAEGRGFDFTKRIVRPDGEIRCVRCVGVPSPHGGTSQGFVGTGIDVTEQVNLIQELRRREAYLAEAQRLSHTGSFGWNIITGDLTWSEENYRIVGYDRSVKPTFELVRDRIHPDDLQMWEEAFARASEGKQVDFEHKLLMPDGAVKHLHVVAYGVHKDGQFVELIGTVRDITEHKRAEETIRRSEAYLAKAQRLSHTGSFGWKPDSGEIIWSAETYRIFEYDRGVTPTIELVARRIHPEDRADFQSVIERVSGGASDFEHTYRLLMPDGRTKHIHALAHATQDASGYREFVGAVTDITDQRRAEESLRKSEAYLADAQKLSRTGSWAWHPEAGITYWSEESYRVQGFDPRDGLPTTEQFFQRIHPADQAGMMELMQRLNREKVSVETNFRIVRPDGAVRDIHSSCHPVLNRSGDLIEFVGTMIDITERKRAEEAIRRSEAYLADAQKLSQTGSWAWSPEGGIHYWSEECYRVQGFNPRDGLPRWEELFQRILPDDQTKLTELIQRIIREKIEFETDYRLMLPDGTVRDIHSTGHPVLGPSGDLIELIGTVIDITERKRAEALLTGEKRLHEMIVTGVPLKEILNALCLMIEDHGGSTLASVLLLSPDGIHLESLAGPSLPEGWTQKIASLPIGPCAGSCGTAAYRGSPVIVSDIATDPLWAVADHRASALSYGLRASWSYPILSSGGKVLGTFCLYYRESRSPSPGDLDLIELAAHLARVAIECKVAEEQLRRSEAYLAEAQKVSHTGSWAWSPVSNTILFWSAECYRILGHDPAKGLPSFAQLVEDVHPEDRPGLIESLDKAVKAGSDWQAEYRLVNFDDGPRTVRCFAHPMVDGGGQVIEFVGTVMDITEAKRVEDAIQRSEALLAEGQRLSHTGSWGWKPATGEMTSSKERFRIFGLDPEKTKPSFEVFWERVHPEDREKLKQTFDTATREKRDFENEYRIVTPDWVIKHVHSVGHAILNESGELVEFIGATMDITSRKRAEERAQSNNEAIRLALNAFVEELDVDRFLGHVMNGLTKQFQATSCELWLFDDPIGANSLRLVYQQGRMIRAKTVDFNTGNLHTTWQPSNIGRIPRIIEISDQASLLQPTHLELLKDQGVKMLMAVPLVLGEQNLGVVELRFQEATKFSRDDLDLAQALVHHATLALQLSRLARRTEQMAVTEERNRMAREIHDTLAQAFAGIVLHSEALGSSLGVSKRRSVMALSRIRKLARSGLDEARRSVQALRPKALEGSNLSEALKQAAKRTNQTGMHACHFRQRGTTRGLSMDAQNELFRIAQEALTNVGKHARAKSVWIDLAFTARQVVLTIRDDGVGFVRIKSTQSKSSYGLATMRERAQRIGAQLEIESHKDGGTSVRVCVPLAKTKKSIKAKIPL